MDTIKKIWDWLIYILFKDVAVFIGSVIAIFILSIALLIYGTCGANNSINMNELVMYPIEKPAQTFPMNVNIVNEFSDDQIQIIENAAQDWNKFSKGRVVINFNIKWIPQEQFSESVYKDFPDKTIWLKTGNEPEVVKLFMKYSVIADAFTVNNFMVIVDPFNNLANEKLYIIALHEFGHFLSLEHIYPKYPALMNVGGNNGNFTNYDKMEFCFLYKCDYKKL